jgi:RNA polymerase sigma-70 factor (ECF subfamily)
VSQVTQGTVCGIVGRGATVSGQAFEPQQVQRLLEGDREAGRAFAARFVPLLRMKLRQRRPGAPEAQIADMVQETLLRVLDALKAGKVHDLHRLGGFVSGVCDNVLLEGATRARRLVALDDIPEPLRALENPEVWAALRERARVAEQVVSGLPAREREVLQLIFVEERDRDEVCKRYGISRDHLRVIVCRARDRLRREFDHDPTGNVRQRA